jgi:cell division protein FtsL
MNDLKRRSSGIRRAMVHGQGRIVLLGALVSLLFAAVGVFHTASRVEGVKAGYALGRVEAEYRELQRENEHLKLERATLRSAPRLETIARARLGLNPPTAAQIVSMAGGRGAPAAPTAAAPAAGQASRVVAQLTREPKTRNP